MNCESIEQNFKIRACDFVYREQLIKMTKAKSKNETKKRSRQIDCVKSYSTYVNDSLSV